MSDCGEVVFVPDDVACYLAKEGTTAGQRIDEETRLLLADRQAVANWAGAAILYHIPTHSTLVLDQSGDVDPQASVMSHRAGLAAFSKLAGNAELMAGIRQQIQLEWNTKPTNTPEIRISAAWQDGPTTIFLISIAGLSATDGRFYCPNQRWMIDDVTIEIIADCVLHEPGTPVSAVFFEAQQIEGSQERPVQVWLNDVPSNTVWVREGEITEETAVYRAVLQSLANRPLLIRGETAAGFEDSSAWLETAVDSPLLENYRLVNETPVLLRFLFPNSQTYFVHPSEAIDRNFLVSAEGVAAGCDAFQQEYPRLGGIVTLSRIGYGADGTQALVHVRHECGETDGRAAYVLLGRDDGDWQVTETLAASATLPLLVPEMNYAPKADGCGDIFVYKSNLSQSEFLVAWVDARAVDLAAGPVVLALADHPELVGARIDVYASRVSLSPYCNDVGPEAEPQSVWQAVSGKMTVTTAANAETEPCTGEPYQATVLLEDLVFVLGEETVQLSQLAFEEVTVGWCAG